MSKDIFEDQQQAPAAGAGGAKAKLEKQARQLAYDTKYKVKQALAAKSGGKADPAAVAKMYLAQLAKSPAPPAVKALAKKKLMGEEYVDVKGFVVDSVTDALLKVFVEKKEEVVEEVIEEEKRTKGGEQKFHVKVTDKKTGNSYHRYATRAKIAELRANPNIASVEMSHYGEGDTKKKAKKDYDGDGKVESSSKEHAGAVHNAIQRRTGGTPDGQDTRKEEVEVVDESGYFPTPASQRADEKKYNLSKDELPGRHKPQQSKPTPQIIRQQQLNQSHKLSGELLEAEESKIGGGNLKKLSKKAVKRIDADVDGDVDTDDMKSDEMGEFVPSPDGKKKIKTKVQKEDYLSNWRDELFEGKDEEEKEIDVMKGKNKIKVMPDLGEEIKVCDKCGKTPCCCDKRDEEEDPRGMKTKANLVRNKLRAMGLKMSHVPEGELIEAKDEDKEEKEERKKAESGEKKTLKNIKKITNKKQRLDKEKYNLQRKGELPLNMSNEPEGETLEEGLPLAIKLGLMAGTAAAGTAIGRQAIDKVKGMVQKKKEAEAPYQKLLNQETEVEGENLQEKPGDGYLGPTPIPNPIRLAKDAVDATNRASAARVKAVNKVLPGSASMPNHTYFNKGPSAASQKYLGLKNSFEPEGETVSEEDADRLRDRRMERGGVGGNRRYDRPPARKKTNAELGIDPKAKTAAQKAAEAKYGKGASAMDIVKAQIRAKHGKGAIMDTKKKDNKTKEK